MADWLIWNPDGDYEGSVRAADENQAYRRACVYVEATDIEVELVTPEMRRAWRNERRREVYAAKRDAGTLPRRSRPPPEGFVFELSSMADLAIHDNEGRCRCPQCKRFCVRADFAKAPTSARIAGACVDFGPACWRCRGLERAPYDVGVTT